MQPTNRRPARSEAARGRPHNRAPTCRPGPGAAPLCDRVAARPPPSRKGTIAQLAGAEPAAGRGLLAPVPPYQLAAGRAAPGRQISLPAARPVAAQRCCSTCRSCPRADVALRGRARISGDRPGHDLLPPAKSATYSRGNRSTFSPSTNSSPRCSDLSSRAEVPLTGIVSGSVIGGLVDRLAVLPDRVLIADYQDQPRATPLRSGQDAAAVSAPDGRLPRRAARDLP